jgi:predicted Zn-dependent protease
MLYLKTHPVTQRPETHRILRAIDGYLFLKMYKEAKEELQTLPETEHNLSYVLLARIRVLLHLKQWRNAEREVRKAIQLHPAEDEFRVQLVFILHQQQKGVEAFKELLATPEWLRRTGIIHYNLACYESRLGDKKIAKRCIDAAIEINAAIKKNARADPDLKALWE